MKTVPTRGDPVIDGTFSLASRVNSRMYPSYRLCFCNFWDSKTNYIYIFVGLCWFLGKQTWYIIKLFNWFNCSSHCKFLVFFLSILLSHDIPRQSTIFLGRNDLQSRPWTGAMIWWGLGLGSYLATGTIMTLFSLATRWLTSCNYGEIQLKWVVSFFFASCNWPKRATIG